MAHALGGTQTQHGMRLMQAESEVVLLSPSSTFQSAHKQNHMHHVRVAMCQLLSNRLHNGASKHTHTRIHNAITLVCHPLRIIPINNQLPVRRLTGRYSSDSCSSTVTECCAYMMEHVCFLRAVLSLDNLNLGLLLMFVEIQEVLQLLFGLAQNVADARTP